MCHGPRCALAGVYQSELIIATLGCFTAVAWTSHGGSSFHGRSDTITDKYSLMSHSIILEKLE